MFHRNDFVSTPDDRYARQLRRGFRGLRFEPAVEAEYRRALVETETISTYAITDGSRTITVSFEVDADRRHLPVALASCGAKYLRELLMARLNAFFARRKPDLKPTAGYHDDAWRWLDDAAEVLSAEEKSALVRER